MVSVSLKSHKTLFTILSFLDSLHRSIKNNVSNLFVNELTLFNNFCSYFRSEASQILSKMFDNPVDLGGLKGSKFFEVDPIRAGLPSDIRLRLNSKYAPVSSP